jgi:hypothetical protein
MLLLNCQQSGSNGSAFGKEYIKRSGRRTGAHYVGPNTVVCKLVPQWWCNWDQVATGANQNQFQAGF